MYRYSKHLNGQKNVKFTYGITFLVSLEINHGAVLRW